MSRILAAGAARMKLAAENYEARIAALEAQLAETAKELSLVRAERDRAQKACEGIAALASTGAVKVSLEDCLSVVDRLENEWRANGWEDEATAACDIAAALYALTPHQRATNTVVSHETGNVEDKIERDGLPRYHLSEGAQERISLLLFEFSATSGHARVAVRLEDLRLLTRLAGVKPHKVD